MTGTLPKYLCLSCVLGPGSCKLLYFNQCCTGTEQNTKSALFVGFPVFNISSSTKLEFVCWCAQCLATIPIVLCIFPALF